jgi:prevent-host-death family protein
VFGCLGGFARSGSANTPRETGAQGPDHKLISVREDGHDHTEAKAKFDALLAEVERIGASVAITKHGRPVAVLMPAPQRPRSFGQLRFRLDSAGE